MSKNGRAIYSLKLLRVGPTDQQTDRPYALVIREIFGDCRLTNEIFIKLRDSQTIYFYDFFWNSFSPTLLFSEFLTRFGQEGVAKCLPK